MPRFENIRELQPSLEGNGLRIGLVMSRFNAEVCEGLLGACLERLGELGVAESDIELVRVPGALEIPLILSRLAATERFDGLVALGAVIRGDTYHFEIVSNEMAAGISWVQLDSGLPVANAVLTTDTDEQALVRMNVKGREAAEVVVEMVHHLRGLS